MASKKPKQPKTSATAIDWVEPYPPGQVPHETDKQKKEFGGDPKQPIMVDNEQLVRVKVVQEIRVAGKLTYSPSEQAQFMSAAFAHAHANAIAAPPEMTEE